MRLYSIYDNCSQTEHYGRLSDVSDEMVDERVGGLLIIRQHGLKEIAMNITRDKDGQPMIEWEMADGSWKRAWIQDRSGRDKDWAGTGKYLNVARVDGPGIGPGGNATDFPIFCDLPNEQILEAFVQSVCAITGCRPRQMV